MRIDMFIQARRDNKWTYEEWKKVDQILDDDQRKLNRLDTDEFTPLTVQNNPPMNTYEVGMSRTSIKAFRTPKMILVKHNIHELFMHYVQILRIRDDSNRGPLDINLSLEPLPEDLASKKIHEHARVLAQKLIRYRRYGSDKEYVFYEENMDFDMLRERTKLTLSQINNPESSDKDEDLDPYSYFYNRDRIYYHCGVINIGHGPVYVRSKDITITARPNYYENDIVDGYCIPVNARPLSKLFPKWNLHCSNPSPNTLPTTLSCHNDIEFTLLQLAFQSMSMNSPTKPREILPYLGWHDIYSALFGGDGFSSFVFCPRAVPKTVNLKFLRPPGDLSFFVNPEFTGDYYITNYGLRDSSKLTYADCMTTTHDVHILDRVFVYYCNILDDIMLNSKYLPASLSYVRCLKRNVFMDKYSSRRSIAHEMNIYGTRQSFKLRIQQELIKTWNILFKFYTETLEHVQTLPINSSDKTDQLKKWRMGNDVPVAIRYKMQQDLHLSSDYFTAKDSKPYVPCFGHLPSKPDDIQYLSYRQNGEPASTKNMRFTMVYRYALHDTRQILTHDENTRLANEQQMHHKKPKLHIENAKVDVAKKPKSEFPPTCQACALYLSLDESQYSKKYKVVFPECSIHPIIFTTSSSSSNIPDVASSASTASNIEDLLY
jgi:hypothetical protein